jgi:hypothetical protein
VTSPVAAGPPRRRSAGWGAPSSPPWATCAPAAAAEALTARLEPLLMALNDRPFAQKVVDARNRAGQAGAGCFAAAASCPAGPGRIHVYQQGGRFEPQLEISLFAASHVAARCARRRDRLSARRRRWTTSGCRQWTRARGIRFFEAFQQTDRGDLARAPDRLAPHGRRRSSSTATSPRPSDLLPHDAVAWLVNANNPRRLDRVFCGRWLFGDTGEDIGITDRCAPPLRWIEQTFTDLLPLWSTVYREGGRNR